MSNENFAYGFPYTSVRPQRQAPQATQSGSYQSQNPSTSTPYYGPQATVAAAATYSAPEYQSQRYTQQRPSNDQANFNWYSNGLGNLDTSQRTDSVGANGTGEEQRETSAPSNNQATYGVSSLGNYAYGSSLNYASNHGNPHEQPTRTFNQASRTGGGSTEEGSVHIPYQPYSRNFEQPGVGTASSSSSQYGIRTDGRHTPAQQASGIRPYMLSNQPAMSSPTVTNSYADYSSNVGVPRNDNSSTANLLDAAQSLIQHQAQSAFSSRHSFERSQVQGLQSSGDQINQGTPTPQPAAQGKKRKATTRTIQQNMKPSPALHVPQPPSSQPHPNMSQYKDPPRNKPSSTSATAANTSHARSQSQTVLQHNVPQSSQSYNAQPLVSAYPNRSSASHPQTGGQNLSEVSRDYSVNLRPQSPHVPTTVDPSHVYNRYHEYQKQIEAADAEHARLAALKAEREAAEAAAATLAAAKSISQTRIAAGTELENGNAHEVGRKSGVQGDPTPKDGNASLLISAGQVTNQKAGNAQVEYQEPQSQASTAGPQRVAAMEEEMRLMVEKMREYQTQDPQLFAHVWESVKKMQAPRPTQAQSRAGEDFVRTSIESQNKQLPSPISVSAQKEHLPAPASAPTEAANDSVPSKPPRKRKSRAKAALLEQAAEKSRRLQVQEVDRVGLNKPSPARGLPYVSIYSQQETQPGPPPTDQGSQRAPNIPVQLSLPTSQHVHISDSAKPQGAINGTPEQSDLGNAAQGPQIPMNTTNPTPIDPALPGNASQAVQPPVVAMNPNAPSLTPTNSAAGRSSTATGGTKTGVLWPEEHKDAISKTAAKVLNAVPENAGRKIAAFQILDMMGYNPSYIELCELIEGIGFKMDRARFAVALLSAIPGVNATPALPAESKVAQLSKTPATFQVSNNRPYHPSNMGPSDASEGSSGAQQDSHLPKQAPSLPPEATTPVPATVLHSGSLQDNHTPRPQGQGSRGPYRKTRERLSGESKPEPRRGRGRPRKDGLPSISRISNGNLNGNDQTSPALATTKSTESQATIQPASQWTLRPPSNIPFDDVEDRLVLALTGRTLQQPESIVSSSIAISMLPAGVSAELPSGLRSQNIALEGQPVKEWRPSIPSVRAANVGMNNGPPVANSPTVISTPRTKEMAARKRTFAELIDLTSDDIPASGGDHQFTDMQGVECYDGAQEPKLQNASLEHRPPQSPSAHATARIKKSPRSHHSTSSLLAAASAVPNPYEDFEDIVKPIDRSVALRKSRYDPKTIARDVLIATARHPLQRGLNAHLEPLKARFKMVDDSSDLSTFRWDVVDPGGPPVGSENMQIPEEEVRVRSTLDAGHSSSSRAVLDGVKLPVGRGPLRPTRGGGPFRGRGGRASHIQKQTITPAQPSGLRFSSTADPGFAVVIGSTAAEIPSDPTRPRNTELTTLSRRIGRPRKDHSATSQQITPLPKRIGRPPKALSSENSMRGKLAERKVGRPRLPALSESKPTRRPRKSYPKPVTPKFIPFLCEWTDCKAELHNLETLRRHIYSVHGKAQEFGTIPCRWSKCGLNRQVDAKSLSSSASTSTPEPRFVREPREFAGAQEFEDHVERAHLTQLAWHMGDGPRGSTLDGSEPDASAYLSDVAGNQVTPSIASQIVAGANSRISRNAQRAVPQKRLYDPALESPVELATPGMRAKFFVGTGWKTIKAPPRSEWRRYY